MIWKKKEGFGQLGLMLMGVLVSGLLAMGCDPVGTSPEPGLLRVVLQPDPADSTIVIADQSYNINEVPALMPVSISQGRAYRDTSYAQLFRDAQDLTTEGEIRINVLRRFAGGQSPAYQIYETLLPPAMYDSLQIVFNADQFLIGDFVNEVSTPPGESPLVTFRQSFQIESEEITTVRITMRPLESLTRFKDVFYFTPEFNEPSVE